MMTTASASGNIKWEKKYKNKVNEIVLQRIIKVYHPDFLS